VNVFSNETSIYLTNSLKPFGTGSPFEDQGPNYKNIVW